MGFNFTNRSKAKWKYIILIGSKERYFTFQSTKNMKSTKKTSVSPDIIKKQIDCVIKRKNCLNLVFFPKILWDFNLASKWILMNFEVFANFGKKKLNYENLDVSKVNGDYIVILIWPDYVRWPDYVLGSIGL